MNISKAEFGQSGWNPFGSASRAVDKVAKGATAAVMASALGQQIEEGRKRQEEQNVAHTQHLERMKSMDVELEKFKTVAPHYMEERKARGEAKRRTEFYKMATEGAQPGTTVQLKMGDYASNLTKSTPPKPTPTSTPTPAKESKPKSNKPPRYYISTRSAKKGKK